MSDYPNFISIKYLDNYYSVLICTDSILHTVAWEFFFGNSVGKKRGYIGGIGVKKSLRGKMSCNIYKTGT